MEYLIIGGISLAIIGYLVYTIRSGAKSETELENKNATLQESRKVADERIKRAEDTALASEFAKRAEYQDEKPSTKPHSTVPFFPSLRKDKGGSGPDDLN